MVMGRLEEQIGGEGVTQRFGIAPDLLLYLNSGRGQLSLEQEPHNPPPHLSVALAARATVYVPVEGVTHCHHWSYSQLQSGFFLFPILSPPSRAPIGSSESETCCKDSWEM